MKKLDYTKVKAEFDKKIFENSKIDLLEKLCNSPSRYIGLFRPSKPHTKIIQNITQSHEIKFGDAFELLIRQCFELYDYESLERNHTITNGDRVNFDQLFKKHNRTIFIEQKVRDDHDSSKKRGQIDNFEKKLDYLISNGYSNISSYIYFIDPSLNKNKNYYLDEIFKLKTFYKTDIELCYGNELFKREGMNNLWDEEIISFLKRWRSELPSLPEINFDLNSKETFAEIKDLPIPVYRKLFDNQELIEIVFPIIFPQKITLQLLIEYFNAQSKRADKKAVLYKKLHTKLSEVIETY
jgi:hypothetical protein